MLQITLIAIHAGTQCPPPFPLLAWLSLGSTGHMAQLNVHLTHVTTHYGFDLAATKIRTSPLWTTTSSPSLHLERVADPRPVWGWALCGRQN